VTTLKQEISCQEEELTATGHIIDHLYTTLRDKYITRIHQLETLTSLLDGVNPIEFSVQTVNDLIRDYYIREDVDGSDSGEGTILRGEFEDVYQAIAFGLSELYVPRMNEFGVKSMLPPERVALLMYETIKEHFPNPNDFVVEYDGLREWHETSEDPILANSFSLWFDMFMEYCHTLTYLRSLKKADNEVRKMAVDGDLTGAISVRKELERDLE
jgi:hypothetical protein